MEFNSSEDTQTSGSMGLDNQTQPSFTTTNPSMGKMYMKNGRDSYFDGGLFEFLGWAILGGLVTLLSFGILYPWSLTMLYGWKINHTVVEGRRLKFSGSAVGLFGNWIKWWFFTLITFGIYGFWVFIKLEDWKAKHTTFAN